MKSVTIDGEKYEVLEDLGNLPGYRQLLVQLPDGTEKMAVKDLGYWRFWSVDDRLEGMHVWGNKSRYTGQAY